MPQSFQLRVPSRLAHFVRSGAPTQLRAWAHHAKLAILTSEHQRAVATRSRLPLATMQTTKP
jgi:hypothetical protein